MKVISEAASKIYEVLKVTRVVAKVCIVLAFSEMDLLPSLARHKCALQLLLRVLHRRVLSRVVFKPGT